MQKVLAQRRMSMRAMRPNTAVNRIGAKGAHACYFYVERPLLKTLTVALGR